MANKFSNLLFYHHVTNQQTWHKIVVKHFTHHKRVTCTTYHWAPFWLTVSHIPVFVPFFAIVVTSPGSLGSGSSVVKVEVDGVSPVVVVVVCSDGEVVMYADVVVWYVFVVSVFLSTVVGPVTSSFPVVNGSSPLLSSTSMPEPASSCSSCSSGGSSVCWVMFADIADVVTVSFSHKPWGWPKLKSLSCASLKTIIVDLVKTDKGPEGPQENSEGSSTSSLPSSEYHSCSILNWF